MPGHFFLWRRLVIPTRNRGNHYTFFSFGSNDLTQLVFGFSRDDAGKFLDAY